MNDARPNPPYGWNDPFHENYLGEDMITQISHDMDDWDKAHPDPVPAHQWAKLGDLKAGDTVELHGFDCASGTVTIEQDVWGELYFPCAQGKHFVDGCLDPNGHLIGITIRPSVIDSVTEFPIASTRAIPTTQESPTMFDPADANSVSRFFQGLADSVIQASTLAKEVEQLRSVVETLKNDVEVYRDTNARLDEEVSRLRNERVALQDENAKLRNDLQSECDGHANTITLHEKAAVSRDEWHTSYMHSQQALTEAHQQRDDAQMRIMELEDTLKRTNELVDLWQRAANIAQAKLDTIHGALQAA